jgi:hypothetical protein
MPQRKTFLTALSAAGLAMTFSRRGDARTREPSGAPSSAAVPPAGPTPRAGAAAAGPVSALAAATAAAMRRFDPHLSDADLAAIARGIDDDAKAAAALNPPGRRLRNGDEPVTVLTVRSK